MVKKNKDKNDSIVRNKKGEINIDGRPLNGKYQYQQTNAQGKKNLVIHKKNLNKKNFINNKN